MRRNPIVLLFRSDCLSVDVGFAEARSPTGENYAIRPETARSPRSGLMWPFAGGVQAVKSA